jgi:hypothetical protein
VSKPPVIGRQLDRCDICGKKVHKINLVRTNVEFLAPEATNYISSSETSSGWLTDGLANAGSISIGPYVDEARLSVGDDNTVTLINGVQTWDGAGSLLSGGAIVNDGVWDTIVFSADIGPYERETEPEINISIGLCDSDGSNKVEFASYKRSSGARMWFAATRAEVVSAGKNPNTVYFYITNSNANKWWASRIQVERDATRPGAYAAVTTAGIDRIDTPMMTMRKVCKSCYEPLLSKTNQYNRESEQRTDEPISVWIQEV